MACARPLRRTLHSKPELKAHNKCRRNYNVADKSPEGFADLANEATPDETKPAPKHFKRFAQRKGLFMHRIDESG
jgi:hypothetical protein